MDRQEEQDVMLREEDAIDLISVSKDFFNNVYKMKGRIIGIALLVALLFTLFASVLYTPKYKAYETYAINIEREYFGTTTQEKFIGNKTAEQINTTLPYILTSDFLKRRVTRILEKDAIPGVISAEIAPNTNFLTVSVVSQDPVDAYETLQAVIESYPIVSEPIIGKISMEMMDGTGVPENPENPDSLLRRMILGFALGLVIMFGWCAFLSLMRKTVNSKEEVQDKLNIRCLGEIPKIHRKSRSSKKRSEMSILNNKQNQEFSESFNAIRNRIEFSAEKNGLKTILLTSAMGSEGKSTVAVNLAISMAEEGKKVALIDCDLRHPSDGKILGYKGKNGLIDYLKGNLSLEKCWIYGKDLLEKKLPIVFIFGGQAVQDGSRYLSLDKMGQMIQMLEKQVDYVILDTAPAGLMTDANILAQYADGVVLVVKSDYVRAESILDAMEQFSDSNVHMIGCVLNQGQ